MSTLSPDKAPNAAPNVPRAALIVNQPKKLESLLMDIATLEKISEIGSGGPGDFGGAVSGGTGQGDDGRTAGPTPRDQAIANLPSQEAMQQQLKNRITAEVKALRRQTKTLTRDGSPGAAYRLNELYASIRRLNSLLAELLDAGIEVVKRLFIRVFIDRQPIL